MGKIVGGLLGGGSQKSSPVQSVTTTTQPPTYLVPYLQDLASKAQSGYNSFIDKGLNQPYTGERIAGANSNDYLAMDNAAGAANVFENSGAPTRMYDFGNMFANKVASGGYTAPGNMAFDSGSYDLSKTINAAIDPVFKQFSERLVPQLKSSAIESGAYGGSKFNEVGERLARDTQDTAANIAANIGYQDFQNKRNLDQLDLNQRRNTMLTGNQQELAAAGGVGDLFSKALGMDLQSSDIFSNIADRMRGFEQGNIDEALANWQEQRYAPWAGLDEYASLINGVAGNAGKSGVQTTSGYTAPGSSFLSGLAGAGAIGSMFGMPSLATIGMNLGAPAGIVNGLASLGSMFGLSDIRLKENIKFEGVENGHNLYSFNYKLQPHVRYIGVMAQEVLKKMPKAIIMIGDYLAVNYSMLNIQMRRV